MMTLVHLHQLLRLHPLSTRRFLLFPPNLQQVLMVCPYNNLWTTLSEITLCDRRRFRRFSSCACLHYTRSRRRSCPDSSETEPYGPSQRSASAPSHYRICPASAATTTKLRCTYYGNGRAPSDAIPFDTWILWSSSTGSSASAARC